MHCCPLQHALQRPCLCSGPASQPCVAAATRALHTAHVTSLQVCGEAKYIDDLDVPPNTLHAALVTSPVPCAAHFSLDSTAATALPGVWGFFSAADVPGANETGAVFQDELVFAHKELSCVGQVVGIVVADSQPLALRAARLVKVPGPRCATLPAIAGMPCSQLLGASGRVEHIVSVVAHDFKDGTITALHCAVHLAITAASSRALQRAYYHAAAISVAKVAAAGCR
jgi:xanthine dehydrogenase molybdopterin-binding subunit B